MRLARVAPVLALALFAAPASAAPSWHLTVTGTATVDEPASHAPCDSADPRPVSARYTEALHVNPFTVRQTKRLSPFDRRRTNIFNGKTKPRFSGDFPLSGTVDQTVEEHWDTPCNAVHPSEEQSCNGAGTAQTVARHNVLRLSQTSTGRRGRLGVWLVDPTQSSVPTFPEVLRHCGPTVFDHLEEGLREQDVAQEYFPAADLFAKPSGTLVLTGHVPGGEGSPGFLSPTVD